MTDHALQSRATRAIGLAVGTLAAVAAFAQPASAQGWEPTKAVTFVIPAGTGGGADQMARFIQGVVTKHNLMKQPMVVINKAGGAGAEGFLDVKSSARDPHKIIITLSNLSPRRWRPDRRSTVLWTKPAQRWRARRSGSCRPLSSPL